MPDWRVPLSNVVVDEMLAEAASDALRSGWWSMGGRVESFEEEFAEFCGSPHAIAVANGTAALHLALLALECGPGDEVVLPSLNFVAAANAVAHTGAKPVFCDVAGPDDLNLDPADLERAVGPRTKGLLVLHYGGHPCDMAAVQEVASRHGVTVLEDAAHAPGATLDGRKCGTFGAAGCFSFFSNKNLPIGEGGMVVTHDEKLATSVRLLRSHGMTTLTWDRHRGHAHSYDVVTRGFNYRLDEVRAAMGVVQLRRLPAENERRAAIVARYREALDGVRGLSMPFRAADPKRVPSHHLAVILVSETVDRNGVQAALRGAGIQTSVHYPPIHKFSAYRNDGERRRLPQTAAVAQRLLTLPLYGAMREEDVETVIDAVLAAV